MADTSIEWTDQTWNPTTGCDRTSPGCDRCYALTMAKRLKGMGSAKYQTDGNPKTSGPGFGLAMHQDALTDPLSWKKPRRVFVNSMSDLFHAKVTDEFIAQAFAVMALTPQHTYQVLTKRHGRMRSLLGSQEFVYLVDDYRERIRPGCGDFNWPLPNVWLGVSVEDQKRADLRIPALAQTPAAVRFLSCEPLLGPVRLPLMEAVGGCNCGGYGPPYYTHEPSCGYEPGAAYGIHWTIIGGESGPGARPLDTAWVADLITDSRAAGAAPFVKQLGSIWARDNNATDAKGGKPADWPEELRVREYPEPR
ncbi:DUF5131 family protein [Streptomyces sp. NPDC060366]|uniref:DUF5131 family protein n=1 Tax=Streptomyces sp. NPDC060366 TaxID=3347105 RepID=UPI00364EE237